MFLLFVTIKHSTVTSAQLAYHIPPLAPLLPLASPLPMLNLNVNKILNYLLFSLATLTHLSACGVPHQLQCLTVVLIQLYVQIYNLL